MSLIARFTAALWAARTDLKIYHQQRTLWLIHNLLPHLCPCNTNLPSGTTACGIPTFHPIAHEKERRKKKNRPAVAKKKKRKKMMMKMMRRVEKGMEAQAQQPNPRRPRTPVSPSQLWLRHNSPAHPVWYSVSPSPFFTWVARSGFTCSRCMPDVTAGYCTRLFWNSPECLDWPDYKGKVFQPTYVAPLPFWAAA